MRQLHDAAASHAIFMAAAAAAGSQSSGAEHYVESLIDLL
jgi:hypothetical protein